MHNSYIYIYIFLFCKICHISITVHKVCRHKPRIFVSLQPYWFTCLFLCKCRCFVSLTVWTKSKKHHFRIFVTLPNILKPLIWSAHAGLRVWLCPAALVPCGDTIQADLFICHLICQTRSNTLATPFQDFFSRCLQPSQTKKKKKNSSQTDMQAQTRNLLSTKHFTKPFVAPCQPEPSMSSL